MLQLYYDGMGVTNPLRSHGSLHNIGAFYYTIKNVPEEFNSCFANVHLLALCYSHDLSVYGYEPVLEKFVSEIKSLSTVGFEGDFPILGHCTVYASLCQVTGDSLALNGLLGFIESFSGSYFCNLCYATAEDIQVHFTESKFQMRTIREYNSDLLGLTEEKQCGRIHRRGVKSRCVLNEIEGFHVTDNWCIDIMHSVLEGVIPIELGCILYGLCNVDRCITLRQVNEQILLLWGKITVDKTQKPAEITKIQEPGHGIVPSMKAVQYWALMKYLPLAVGSFVPVDNEHWQFLLHLSHMVDLIFARYFTAEMARYLKLVISDHLSDFLRLYGNVGAKLRPKHHFLVHLPTIILKSGPLHGMCCLRYELKNSFFKRCAHIVCNFKNICHTLAHRHQQNALFSQLSNAHIRNALSVEHHSVVTVGSLPYSNTLHDHFGMHISDDIAVAKTICVASVKYKDGHLLFLNIDSNSGKPTFCRISGFVSPTGDSAWHVVGESVVTNEYVPHSHAYSVAFEMPCVYSLHLLSDVLDHHPLYCHTMVDDPEKRHFVRLPYHIF